MRRTKNILILFTLLISTIILGQNDKMKYNHNSIDQDFIQSEKVSSLFSNKIDEAKILIVAEIENDSIFSIYLKNNKTEVLKLSAQDSHLQLIQEAKDTNGNWKPIEYWRFSTCGNSYRSELIEPGKIIKTESRKYSGKFKTEVRFKLLQNNEVFYSNFLICNINQSLFKISDELRNDSSYRNVLKVSDEALAEKVVFLEPNSFKEFSEKNKKWMAWVTEQNRKRNEKENKK